MPATCSWGRADNKTSVVEVLTLSTDDSNSNSRMFILRPLLVDRGRIRKQIGMFPDVLMTVGISVGIYAVVQKCQPIIF